MIHVNVSSVLSSGSISAPRTLSMSSNSYGQLRKSKGKESWFQAFLHNNWNLICLPDASLQFEN